MIRAMEHFDSLPTPCLLLDRTVLESNCRLMAEHMTKLGVRLRPHMKTAKSAEVARLATQGHFGGITVSTLKEAHYFAERGFKDILYAVGFVPSKIGEAAAIQEMGDQLILLTDSMAAAAETAIRAAKLGRKFPMMIEIDTGDGRCGLDPDSEAKAIVELGRVIDRSSALELRGVLTHAGQSYKARSVEAIRAVAERERAGIVKAAALLRDAGLPCPVVSAGSTPTARYVEDLTGVTEMRPGVYMFGDVTQALVGSCTWDHIAVTVLASVMGHNHRTGRIVVDAGGLALSKDIGPAAFDPDSGYGTVMGDSGKPRPDRMFVAAVSQEHGLLALPGGGPPPWDEFPVGGRVRIFPNHVCMTAAAHDRYHVLDAAGTVAEEWPRINGW
jgi:D-serine deaminase-like pyridoxal phosphate-dependent protein